jgi:hypothetical protein
MELISEFLSLPEILFIGRLLLGTSFFLCSYSAMSEFADVTSSNMLNKLLATLVSLYAFQIPFSALGVIPSIGEVVTFFNLIMLLICILMIKYTSGLDLMISQLIKRKLSAAIFVAALFVFVFFLPIIIQLLREQLGAYFCPIYNFAWIVDFGLTLLGAVQGVFGMFRDVAESIVGRESFALGIAFMFVVVSITVIPQMLPYSNIVTKCASTVGILTAGKWMSHLKIRNLRIDE